MKHNNRILICDDNPAIHEDFRKVLCPTAVKNSTEISAMESDLFGDTAQPAAQEIILEYDIDSAHQGQEAFAKIAKAHEDNRPYALTFMDVRMPPGWDGIETIARIWEKYPTVEVVICTAYSDYAWDDIVAKLGSTDRLLFVTKPFDAIVIKQMAHSLIKKWNLGAQARYYVNNLESEIANRTQQLQSLLNELESKNKNLAQVNQQLEHIALHDPLTALANRSLFSDRIQHAVKMARRDSVGFAVIMIDLDQFKEINDVFGHSIGDEVLKETAARLAQVLRDSDTVARLGGDEFASILRDVDKPTAIKIAERVVRCLEPPIQVKHHYLSIACSVGVALFPEHGSDEESILRNADSAMYVAKTGSKGVHFFDPLDDSKHSDDARLGSDLEATLTRRELDVAYQPIVDLARMEAVGVEVLARWTHPERGNIPPDKFIRLAEQKRLIDRLTFLVLEFALTQYKAWAKVGVDLPVSVNLSVRSFLDPTLPTRLAAMLEHFSVPPEKLKLEITESMTIADPGRAYELVQRFHNMGVRISVDDFGTGYSALSYLKRFPLHEIKIDRAFIQDLSSNHESRIIVQSTIGMAHLLGIQVVAEGIEEAETAQLLRTYGCDRGQGFHFAKPMPGDQMLTWLSSYQRTTETVT